jgi:hypothetical protein
LSDVTSKEKHRDTTSSDDPKLGPRVARDSLLPVSDVSLQHHKDVPETKIVPHLKEPQYQSQYIHVREQEISGNAKRHTSPRGAGVTACV